MVAAASDDLEGVVDAAAGAGQHLTGDVDHGRVDDVGGTATSRELELAGVRSTATIVAAPASRAPAMTCSPTPPQPITQTLSPMLDMRGVRDRADPGHDATPQAAPPATTESPPESTTAPAVGTTACSAKQATIRPWWSDAAVRAAQPRGSVHQGARQRSAPAGSHRFRLPRRHARQFAAGRDEAERDVVAGRDPADVGLRSPHHAGALMAEHHRPAAAAQVAVGQVHVGVTDARRPRRGRAPRRRRGGSSSTVSTLTGTPGSRSTTARIDRVSLIAGPGRLSGGRRRRPARHARSRRSRRSPATIDRDHRARHVRRRLRRQEADHGGDLDRSPRPAEWQTAARSIHFEIMPDARRTAGIAQRGVDGAGADTVDADVLARHDRAPSPA